MSKKNNQQTRAKAHAFQLRREKEAQQKKEEKAQRKQVAEQQNDAGKSLASRGGVVIPSPNKLGVAGKKFKRKGIRLRKNHMVRGIRIKDASSKRKVKDILAAEEAMREMMVDDDNDETVKDAEAGASKLGATKKKSKKVVLKKKKGKEPKAGLFSAPSAMKVD